jgi:hypothetical protein
MIMEERKRERESSDENDYIVQKNCYIPVKTLKVVVL